MSDLEKASMWRRWGSLILGGLLVFLVGLEVGAEAMRIRARDTEVLLQQADDRVNEAALALTAAKTQVERFKNAYVITVQQLADLQKQLDQARAAGRTAIEPESPAQFTVLYEAGGAQLNVSLLPLPGAPRIALAGALLGPRWIVPGRVLPEMLGETRQAMYYFYDASNSTWQGPFGPKRVTQ